MTFRPFEQPSRVARLALRTTYLCVALATAFTLSGCPDGAELEDAGRFPQYTAGVPGAGGATGGSAGVGGATGGAGAAQGGSAGTTPAGGAGAGGSAGGGAGTAGTGSGTWTWNCPTPLEGTMGALAKNCARTGCHNTLDAFAGLDMTNPATLRAAMVDQPATFGDIGCNAVGTPFRACTREEALALGCPPDAKLIDSANFANSWVVKKLEGMQGECGDAMPIAPGNSVSNGWDAAGMRKACYLEFFQSLAATQ